MTKLLVWSVLSIGLEAYSVWQGPFNGKWAEAAFWMGSAISAEIFRARAAKDASIC